jgi:hypothetical protein
MVTGVNGLVGRRVLPAVEMVLSIEQGTIEGFLSYNICDFNPI